MYSNTSDYDAVDLVTRLTLGNEPEVKQWQLGVAMATIQWVIFVVGTVGNLLVVVVLLWHRHQKYKVTQLLVGALSVANLGNMTSSAWVQGLLYIDNRWPFDLVGCKVYFTLQAITPYFSMWTLATLAIDRYIGLTKPAGESSIPAAAAAWIVMAIWMLIVIANMPLLLWSGLSYDVTTAVVSCVLVVANGNAYDTKQTVFISCSRVFDYFIPLFINWFCYVSIVHKFRSSLTRCRSTVFLIAWICFCTSALSTLQRVSYSPLTAFIGTRSYQWRDCNRRWWSIGTSKTCKASSDSYTTHRGWSPAGTRRRVTLMCLFIAGSFTATTLPYQTVIYVVTFTSTGKQLVSPLRTAGMLNACLHPVIFGLMWRPFQQSLSKLVNDASLCCRLVSTRRSTSNCRETDHGHDGSQENS